MLWAAQAFRLLRRIEEGLGAVGPDQAAAGGLEDRPFVGGADIEQAGFALDHDVAGIGGGGGDQGDAFAPQLDLARTHSAPARVLPKPRPARISQ